MVLSIDDTYEEVEEEYLEEVSQDVEKDEFYNNNEKTLVDQALSDMGFGFLSEIFYEQDIDFEAFVHLKSNHITLLLGFLTVGKIVKFEKKRDEWILSHQDLINSQSSQQESNVYTGIVNNILNTTNEGQAANFILDRSSKLDKKGEAVLSGVICSYFLALKRRLVLNDLLLIAEDIERSFPFEKASSYVDTTQKRGKGVLYDKYHNKLRSLRDTNMMPSSGRKRKNPNNEKSIASSISFLQEEIRSNDFVKTTPINVEYNILKQHWQRSSKIRLDSFKVAKNNFSSLYRLLQRPDGYELISLDFDTLYSGKNFKEEWIKHQDQLIEILERDVKQDSFQQSLRLRSKLTSNQLLALILLGLHHHLFGLKIGSGGGKNIVYKPTIYDTFTFMVYVISDETNFELELNQRKQYLNERKLEDQAIIFGFGPSIEQLQNKFCVMVEDITYIFEGETALLNALECILKVYHVFNIEYPRLNKSVYQFLSAKYLKIETTESVSNKVTRLINTFIRD